MTSGSRVCRWLGLVEERIDKTGTGEGPAGKIGKEEWARAAL